MILLVAALAVASPPPVPAWRGFVAIVRSRVVRVLRIAPTPPLIERKGPKCVPAIGIAGAEVVSPTQIDLAMRGGERLRARLDDDCPALDFYRGFYVSPREDGRICAGRDAIRTRSGGECAIERFRRLVPAAP